MIAINTQLLGKLLGNALESGRVRDNSSPYAYLLQALVHLRYAFTTRETPPPPTDDPISEEWSGHEVAVADAINWLFAYLGASGCGDIEKLLDDCADFRMRNPDYPSGAWPYHKSPV